MGKSVALVLGSGGARGMAHVGVIRWLEENGYDIKTIAGCSIGSFIGGAYAAGRLDQVVDWLVSFNRADIYRMMDLSFRRDGLIEGEVVVREIQRIVGDVAIEDLKIDFTAVAADIANEKEVWFNSGPLYRAIRASVSLPLFMSPYTIDGVQYIDGGILNPTPMEPVMQVEADIRLAVNLGAPAIEVVQPARERSYWQQKMDQFLDRMKASTGLINDQWSMLYIADQTFNTMQNALASKRMEDHPPDVLIDVPRNACGTLDFDRSKEMIEYGYRMAEDIMGKS